MKSWINNSAFWLLFGASKSNAPRRAKYKKGGVNILPENFWKWYLVLIIPSILVFLLDVHDRVKHKNKKYVGVWFPLVLICFLSTFVGLLGAVSNGLDEEGELWFVAMMSVCYVGMIICIRALRNKRIVYSEDEDYFSITLLFREEKIKFKDVTRIYLSNQYLDIYIKERRIRIGSNFLVGAEEFERYVKDYMMKVYGYTKDRNRK